jgi:hypothetical protein
MAEYLYRLGGRVISCDRPLHGIAAPAVRAAQGEIRIRVAGEGVAAPRGRNWFHAWIPPGSSNTAQLRFALAGDRYLLDVPRAARFLVSEAGDEITCFPSRGLGRSRFYHLLLDQALPLALGLMGDLVLHASAVVHGEEAMALAGPSGRGKSTLAAHLGARGAQVLTDDCLVLRDTGAGWLAFAFDQGIRLWQDSARAALGGAARGAKMAEGSAKVRVQRHPGISFRREPAPLGCIVLPQERRRNLRRAVLTRFTPREGMMALLPQMFFFEVHRKLALRNQFERLSRLAESVPLYRLDLPANLASLRDAGDMLVAATAGDRAEFA